MWGADASGNGSTLHEPGALLWRVVKLCEKGDVMHRWFVVVSIELLALAGCATYPGSIEPVRVSLADISMLEFGLIEQKLGLRLRVQNPNSVAVPIEGLSYELELNGKPFAQGVAHPKTQVPEFGSAEIDTEAVSNLSSLISQ
jgi:LEA14-like dessication related protein